MIRRFFRTLWLVVFNVARFSLLTLVVVRLLVALLAAPRQFSAADVSPREVAVVFGAGLRRDGGPTTVLRDRVATAADLYFAGKVSTLLMSGGVSGPWYNEPEAMRAYARQLGVPDEAILVDYAGTSTSESCVRLRPVFGVESAILVTQPFHLPRALFYCDQYGVDAVGVPADRFNYRFSTLVIWHIRESVATLAALWTVGQGGSASG